MKPFFNSTLWKIRCSLKPKAQAVNKAQRQLRPKPYYPEFFKSRALEKCKFGQFSMKGNFIEKLYKRKNQFSDKNPIFIYINFAQRGFKGYLCESCMMGFLTLNHFLKT